MSHLVSVIMPAYNAERYIAEAIQSVLDQTYKAWELIVVDDGSQDKTAEIVRTFERADNRIRYLHQENGRLGKARNTGLKNSNGELIAFLDSDDLWTKEKLDVQVAAIAATEVDLLFSDGFIFFDGNITDETVTFATPRGKFDGPAMLGLLLDRNSIPVLSVLLRRSLLSGEDQPFEEEPSYHGCEDYDLWLRLAERGAVFYGSPEKLVRYRRHPAAMTHKDSEVLKPVIAVLHKHSRAGGINSELLEKRLRRAYRELIAALLVERKDGEAVEWMKALASWDKSGVITRIQKLLIRLLPTTSFNYVSRELLYRAEWHLGRIAERSTSIQTPKQIV